MTTEQENGLLLQGAGGDVFFIPADRMSEFRVADEDAAGVKSALDEIDADAEVSGFSHRVDGRPDMRNLKVGVTEVRAFQGPLGIKPPTMQIDEGDGIYR